MPTFNDNESFSGGLAVSSARRMPTARSAAFVNRRGDNEYGNDIRNCSEDAAG
jgi:hypothetical protein